MALRTYCDRCGSEIPELVDMSHASAHTVWVGKKATTCCNPCLDVIRMVLRDPSAAEPRIELNPPDTRTWWQRLLGA
jgi:hypothetical protein